MKILNLLLLGCLIASYSLFGQNKESKFEVSVRKVDKIQMVYYDFTGPYNQSFNDFGQLMAFINKNNLKMDNFSIGIFYDDPEVTPEDELRSKIGHVITSKAKITGEKYKYKEIPEGKAVTVRYKSMEDIMPAYQAISKYIMENNLKTEDYSIELYYGQDPNTIDAEILFYLKDK